MCGICPAAIMGNITGNSYQCELPAWTKRRQEMIMLNRSSVLAVLLVLFGATAGSVSMAQGNLGNPGVAPPNSSPYGASYAEWAVRWWQWSLAIPASTNPILHTTGLNFDAAQPAPLCF